MSPDEAIEFMRKNKVIHLRLPDGLELSLASDALVPETVLPAPELSEEPDDKTVGSGGMTRAEQLLVLGQVFEADFKKRK